MGSMRVKVRKTGNVCKVKMLIKHQMISYQKANQIKAKPNFVTSVIAKVGGEVVYKLNSSQFISSNPYFVFKFYAISGELLEITWIDLLGNSDTKYKII